MYSSQPASKSKYLVLTADTLIPVFIIIFVIFAFWFTLFSKYFAVQTIECTLDYQPCGTGPFQAELNKYKGSNIFRLDTSAVSRILTSGDFTVRDVEFRKKYPSTLRVSMLSVYPIAAITVQGVADEWLVLDNKYRVIGLHHANPNVPSVAVSSPISSRIGEEISDRALRTSIDFAITLNKEISMVESISLQGDTLTINLGKGRIALMSIMKEALPQIRLLQAILADTTMSQEVRSIDVRFSKPVLNSN